MSRLLFRSAALALCAVLYGCAADLIPPSTAMADGAATRAPAGWIDYCARHGEDPACR